MKLQEKFYEYGVGHKDRTPMRGNWTSDFDEAVRTLAGYVRSVPEKDWQVYQREVEIHATDWHDVTVRLSANEQYKNGLK